jgi:hypothetical protein
VERFLESERAQAAQAIEALQRQSQLKRAE